MLAISWMDYTHIQLLLLDRYGDKDSERYWMVIVNQILPANDGVGDTEPFLLLSHSHEQQNMILSLVLMQYYELHGFQTYVCL